MPASGNLDPSALFLEYLDGAANNGRAWAYDGTPLHQPVNVPSGHWRTFADGLTMAADIRAGVLAAVEAIGNSNDVVDRSALTKLAADAGAGPSDLVSCWFTVMCWGAGPRDQIRLRQWTRALSAEGFIEALDHSRTSLLAGDLPKAYRQSKLPGVGESFLTKWLWALGLPSGTSTVRPYVLDQRVWAVASALGWSPDGKNPSVRWANYCDALDRWARTINLQRPGWRVDGDRLEQLMFDRSKQGMHFYGWLRS